MSRYKKAELRAVISADARAFYRTMGKVGHATVGLAKALAAGGAAAAAGWAVLIKSTADYADEIGKTAKRTGITTDELQRLSLAAKLSGTDLGSLEKGVKRMQQSIFDLGRGLSTATEYFSALGLTFADLKKRSPTEQFHLIMTRLAGVADASRQAALAANLFGRAGTKLLPMLSKGAAGFEQLRNEAERLGIIMDPAQIAAAEDFNDSLLRVGSSLRGIAMNAAARSLAPLSDAFNSIATNEDVMRNIGFVFDRLGSASADLAVNFAAFAANRDNIEAISGAVESIADAIKVIVKVGSAMSKVSQFLPVPLAIRGAAAGYSAIKGRGLDKPITDEMVALQRQQLELQRSRLPKPAPGT